MLDSRRGQAAVMTAAIGMVFGMALAPLPNVTSKYILDGVLEDIDFHYERHQAAVEATKIASSSFRPKYKVSQYQIQNPIHNPADCDNNDDDYFQFEKSIFSSHNCVEPSETSSTYYYGPGYTYSPQITDTPPRISFYVSTASDSSFEGQNSMFIKLGGRDS